MIDLSFENIMAYSPENKKVFEELSGLCINKMIVPYIGAGMSVFAGFKTWNKFINDEYGNCFHTTKPDDMNNIVAADLIEQKQGKDIFYENVRITLGGNLNDTEWKNILKKAEIQAISIIPKLFYGPIITTNFDQIIENTHDNKLSVVFPYNSKELEQAIDNRKRLVYKIHGCVSDAQKIVFTKSVYDKVYNPDSELVKSLSAFFQGFHFLFLGSSLGVTNAKGDTKDYSMDLWEKLQDSGTYHFAIIDCTKDQLSTRRKELEERNIHPILFKSGEYESVKIILDELLTRYENQLLGIPLYTSPFVERKESILEKITNQLNDKEWTALAIIGFGGVGKTRILSEYANRKKQLKAYKHIIWFNAISADNVREEIFQFTLRNKLIAETEKNYDYIDYVFKKWMKDNEDWLFSLDNVEHYDDIKAFFDFDKTLKGKRHILISSRNKDEFPNIPLIQIDIFEIEESREFLKSHTNKTPDEYADKIADRLGGLPLALEQTAAYIREENESYKKYFELLEKDTILILEKKHLSHTESVGATWNISMQRIKSKAARELLHLCVFFAPDNIHSQWFLDVIDILPEELKKNILTDFIEIRKELQAYSLVIIDSKERISMHRLLQEVIRNTLKEEKEYWIDICIQILNRHRFFNFSNVSYRILFIELVPHITKVMKEITSKTETIKVANLYSFLGIGFMQLSDYLQALEWFYKALCVRLKVQGKEHIDTATTYSNIGIVFEKQGLYKDALKWYGESLSIRKKINGKEIRPEDATIFDNIAGIYNKQGEYEKALNWYLKALTISKHGENQSQIASTYNNLGGVFYDLRKYDIALNMYLKSLEILQKISEIDNLKIAATYGNIAALYNVMGKYKEALILFMNSINLLEKVLGKEHPDIASLYNNIGLTYDNMGEYVNALDWYKKALFIREKILGIGHPNTATTYHNIAAIYNEQGNYNEALMNFFIAFITRLYTLGEEHPSTKNTYNGLIMSYENIDNTQSFEEWLEERMQSIYATNQKNK
ncbi:MAG: tetratricopeptide repeat protein [Tannerella sp.]|jgi:tetratricopeptide (TPR) repeat protein|nr:tetratricopeptide repeat protein [Tannerella sp.]